MGGLLGRPAGKRQRGSDSQGKLTEQPRLARRGENAVHPAALARFLFREARGVLMRTTEAELQSALGKRLADLSELLSGALEIGELRDAETVQLAKDALLHWLCDGWDGNGGDTEGALAHGLECYVEHCPQWARGRSSIETDLSLSAKPPWELPEFHLLVASLLADQALLAFRRGTKKQAFLAAMLYADAIESQEHWDHLRGPAGARNPDTWRGQMQSKIRELDERIAGDKALKQKARKAIKAKLQNDPKQAAKAEAFQMWQDWQAGKAIHASGAAFARHVVEQTAIEDTNTVQRWMRGWRAMP
ncbi:MAG: hypothetical protein KGL71_11460 [Xanthomonadaceae bacterium]|nr:hypothetical protein [Xanthomonadaceae bacterium]